MQGLLRFIGITAGLILVLWAILAVAAVLWDLL
jgi:hypothetical protein